MNSSDMARWFADVAARKVQYRVVACETCLDLGRVNRLHAGVGFEEYCPEGCEDDEEDDVFVGWDASAELLDDMRRDDRDW